MVVQLRLTTKSTTLHLLIENYCCRSMQFAASWLLRSFDSGKLHCVLLVNVRRHCAASLINKGRWSSPVTVSKFFESDNSYSKTKG